MSINALKIDEIKNKLNEVKNEDTIDRMNTISSDNKNIEILKNSSNNTENSSNNTENSSNNTENITCMDYNKEYVVCSECNRTILRKNLSQHQKRTICVIGNIQKQTMIKDIINNKFNKYEILYMRYKSEKNINNKIKLFDNLKSLFNYINMRLFNSYKYDENIKEKLIDQLFILDYNLSKEHYKFLG